MRAILTFHAVDESGSVLSIHPQALDALLAGVRASGHRIVPVAELLAEPAAPDRVAISFDDGMRSVFDAALPVLRAHAATATLFLTTGHVGGHNDWAGQPAWVPKLPMLDWGQVEALAAAQWSVESHGVRHADLRRLDDAALDAELADSAAALEQRLGRRPALFAYPYGAVDARVAAHAARHYSHCFTTELRALDGLDARRLAERGVPRLDGYYLQPGFLHQRFGGPLFRGWIGARALLRRLRAA